MLGIDPPEPGGERQKPHSAGGAVGAAAVRLGELLSAAQVASARGCGCVSVGACPWVRVGDLLGPRTL